MPWKSQGGGQGGPWGGGGGSGGGGGGGGNPFGPGGGGGRGPQPPDIEEMLRKSQDKVKRFMPGSGGGLKVPILLGLVAVIVWGLTGFYRVQPGEQGVELLFGEYIKRTGPGLHYWPPQPIGTVIKPKDSVWISSRTNR